MTLKTLPNPMPKALSAMGMALVFGCMAVGAQTVQKAPLQVTSPASGEQMFKAYCASCHGLGAKGDGPAAGALKRAPADLTTLSQRNGGKFPELKVASMIKGDAVVASHGSRDMPIWGELFSESISHGAQSDVQMRVANLTSYIRSLQAK